MGTETRKKSAPPLPAPTETESLSSPTELATDVSKAADEKSSYSLPDDGTPVTIKTRGHRPNRSQTSLLIEYFEGGRAVSSSGAADRKPSVRVRLTPSKSRKNDRIQITETKAAQKTSPGRRSAAASGGANLDGEPVLAAGGGDLEDAKSMSSYASATEESNVSRNPIDIEIDRSGHSRRRRPASPLIPSREESKAAYEPPNMSDISAIPTDSFLDGSGPTSKTPDGKKGRSPSRGAEIAGAAVGGLAAGYLADKMISKGRREERERVVIPKSRDRDKPERKQKSGKSRTSSLSDRDTRSPRRRSSRGQQESVASAADSSVVSSEISPSSRSVDRHSIRSGTSKASINNPQLLESVEDVIRRLILPEIHKIRDDNIHRDRRGSVTSSGTSVSRDEYSSDRRRSSRTEKGESPRDSYKAKERRDREARHDLDESPAHTLSHESLEQTAHDAETTPRRSSGKLRAAAAGAAIGGLAAAALHHKDETSAEDPRQPRRRRRAELRGRGSDRTADDFYDEDAHEPVAPVPLPLQSEINPSEVTRTSILSADTDRPHSASEELARDGTSSPTPTRSPATLQALGAQHANISHGDLKALPRERAEEYDEQYAPADAYGQRDPVPMAVPEPYDEDDEYDETVPGGMPYVPGPYDYYNIQEVPPPLRYVPYQPERRGLSPIPSVSGYTEGGSEQPNWDSRVTQTTTGSVSSPEKSPRHQDVEAHSPSSIPSNVMSREFVAEDGSPRSSAVDYRHTTYTDDSELDRVTSGQAVRAVGANPNFVHPVGVESAVASLVDGSVLDDSLLAGDGYDRDQHYSQHGSIEDVNDEEGSHGRITPTQESVASQRDEVIEDRGHTPTTASQHSREYADEYDIDDYGQKVRRSRYRQSPTASEAAIIGAAVGATAAALRAAKNRSQQHLVEEEEREAIQDFAPVGAGVVRNKSFKQRTIEGQRPANTPTHSLDRFVEDYDKPRMGASGIPDLDDPMPEIGYFGPDDDLETNPSVVDGRLGGSHAASQDPWQSDPTPTEQHLDEFEQKQETSRQGLEKPAGLGITEVAGAAALATAAAMASSHSRRPSQEQEEEWQRTSDDRKRDTLLTNPYEGASPIVNLPGINDNLLPGAGSYDDGGYGPEYGTRSPLGPKIDEGYISQGPNKSPEIRGGGKGKGVELKNQASLESGDDPFFTSSKHARHLSGMSQGMASPFYDGAMGTGIDRIESKDIIALMQHLMVRDAQRSARDTEILVTLVRSAAEMRSSFEDIKNMLADAEDGIISGVRENTEKSVRNAIGGPRPFPGSAPRSVQGGGSLAGTIDDLPQKKHNIWKRALKGLSSKSNNDLGRIEDMLNQLLTEVDTLRAQQQLVQNATATTSNQGAPSFDMMQPEAQYEHERGYEPEGNAGTSTASHASQSGQFSVPQSRVPSIGRLGYDRKFSDHRISTVPEANEEEFDRPDADVQAHYSNPNVQDTAARRGSEPLSTPPQPQAATVQTSQTNENTPNTPKTDRGKKHSSWFPKISRWSETTTSSVSKAVRNSGRKENDEPGALANAPSRSGSDLAAYEQDYAHTDPYGDDKLHSGFSEPDIHNPASLSQPPTARPRVSSLTSMTPENPKYHAHRNSLNLQHPQPRQGQSERFKVALESQAQVYDSPMSPKSADWAGSATSLTRLPGRNASRESYDSAGAHQQDQSHSWHSSPGAGAALARGAKPTGPPRPPKEPLDDTSNVRAVAAAATPPRNSRISKLQKASPLPYQSVESGYGTATHGAPTVATGSHYSASPTTRPENRNLSGAMLAAVPTRRPSGPRAMTPRSGGGSSPGEELGGADSDVRRRKRDTFGTINSEESETF